MESSQAFVDKLKDTPIGRQLIEQDAAEKLEARRAIQWELDELDAARRKELPPLQAQADKAQAAHDEARAKFEAAERDNMEATRKLMSAKASTAARRNRLKGRLRATAPPQIDHAIERLRNEQTELRGRGVKTAKQKTDIFSGRTGELVKEHYSDAPSIAARLAAIQGALLETDSLKFQIMEPAELDARLASLYDALPAVEAALTGRG